MDKLSPTEAVTRKGARVDDRAPTGMTEFFGAEVRAARNNAGLTLRELGEELGYTHQQVHKVETGARLASTHFAEGCDRVFRTPGYFARLRQRAADSGYPSWLAPYVDLERQAARIYFYAPTLVPGLFQTEEYAHAALSSGRATESPETIKARVESRTERRRILERPSPPAVWVVIHEAALHTMVGNAEVMRRQLCSLLAAADGPGVTVQVWPSNGGVPPSDLSLILLAMPNGRSVLYSEAWGRGFLDDSAELVSEATEVYDQLQAGALTPRDSLSMIRARAEAFTT